MDYRIFNVHKLSFVCVRIIAINFSHTPRVSLPLLVLFSFESPAAHIRQIHWAGVPSLNPHPSPTPPHPFFFFPTLCITKCDSMNANLGATCTIDAIKCQDGCIFLFLIYQRTEKKSLEFSIFNIKLKVNSRKVNTKLSCSFILISASHWCFEKTSFQENQLISNICDNFLSNLRELAEQESETTFYQINLHIIWLV